MTGCERCSDQVRMTAYACVLPQLWLVGSVHVRLQTRACCHNYGWSGVYGSIRVRTVVIVEVLLQLRTLRRE